MKLIEHFADFLRDTVNLNQTRIDNLEASVESIKTFIKSSDWKPRVWKFVEQGSWAHDTIIRPVEGSEFDADLLVEVDHVPGWTAADYISSLEEVFNQSELYKDKVKGWEYCVTITYAGFRKIDIAPCIRSRESAEILEVCNAETNRFQRSEPIAYTEWFNERNSYSGNNSFRKVTRLIKYLRDIRKDFSCPSVLLTTLIGNQISWSDKGSAHFADIPTTLKTIIGRLDDWLQAQPVKPYISNPKLISEDLAENFSQEEYATFRTAINVIRSQIDDAFAHEERYASILGWRKVFGEKFAKGISILSMTEEFDGFEYDQDENVLLAGVLKEDAWHDSRVVNLLGQLGRWIWKAKFDRPKHMHAPIWQMADIVSDRVNVHAVWQAQRNATTQREVSDFETLTGNGGLWFDVTINENAPLPTGYYVRYRITNTGSVALSLGKGRGGFETPQEGTRRWEALEYSGVHLTEAYVIRSADSKIVGISSPFHVVIE